MLAPAPTLEAMHALMGIGPWLKPYWRWVLGSAICSVCSVLINLLIPFQTARIIDQGIAQGDSAFVQRTVVLMVTLIVFGMLVASIAGALAVRASFYAVTDLRQDLYGHIQDLSFGNLDRRPTGELLTRLTSDITKVQTGLTMSLLIGARAPVVLVGALFAIVWLDPSLSAVALVMVPVILVIVGYTVKRSGVMYERVQSRLDRLNTVLQENIDGAELVKAFVRQGHEIDRFDDVADDLADQAIRVNQLVASLMPALVAVASFAIAAVLWIGGANVIEGTSTEGNLVAFISYVVLVSIPLILFSFLQPLLTAAGTSLVRIEDVLYDDPEVEELEDASKLRRGAIESDIFFNDVSLAYRSGDDHEATRFALHNVTLHIPRGQVVAILGATGSGKSSLVNLIPRFYDVSSGSVLVGRVDVRYQPLRHLRSTVGVALQSQRLFRGTVAENLRLGRDDASDGQLASAAMAAQAHEFICRLPDGYESMIEQGGANLSGGQRQRLAIARTLVSDPDIYILDDSTSAVDLNTEIRVQDAFADLTGRTVIMVAQRISTALAADRIVVMDEGRIVGDGKHDQLIQSCRTYHEIYASQLGVSAR